MLKDLKNRVYEQNMELQRRNMVQFTWGNVSGINEERTLVVIKPSGIPYEALTPESMVVVDLEGNIVEGKFRPSSDTKTHLEMYKSVPEIQGIVHTHSTYATGWAQSGRDIPCYGTTHADYFHNNIPCVPSLTQEEINEDYEKYTGTGIIDYFKKKNIKFKETPAALCKNHGVFTWGESVEEALHNAVVVEEIAKMAFITEVVNPNANHAPSSMINKHYERKHGKNAYYGQE